MRTSVDRRHRDSLGRRVRRTDAKLTNERRGSIPSSCIIHYYPDRPLIGLLAYSGAVAVGLSRINDEKHWPSDVFFGAVLGYTVGRTIVRNAGRVEKKKARCMPYTGPGGSGIVLIYKL